MTDDECVHMSNQHWPGFHDIAYIPEALVHYCSQYCWLQQQKHLGIRLQGISELVTLTQTTLTQQTMLNSC